MASPEIFTVFSLAQLISDSSEFYKWLNDKKLLINFSDVLCECGSAFNLFKDSAYSTDGQCWKCVSSKCRRRFSIRSGSWFQGSHLSLEKILQVTYFWARDYSNKQCSFECGVSEKTVVDWFSFCRELCVDILNSEDRYSQIGGDGVVVEIDEFKFEKSRFHKGKRVDGVWIFGGIETGERENCFFVVVEDRSSDTLLPIIHKFIKKGSVIISGCCEAYDELSDHGYVHQIVDNTNTVGSAWYSIKSSKSSLYFAEFVFRRKFFARNNFLTFIEFIAEVYSKDKAVQSLQQKWTSTPVKRKHISAPVVTPPVVPTPVIATPVITPTLIIDEPTANLPQTQIDSAKVTKFELY